MLNRREVVKQVLENRPANLFAVSGLGSPTWDVAAAGNHKNDFQFIGAMGQAGPFALGLALVQPKKRIVLITGDGELLMALGPLATIGNQATENLMILVLDNGAYLETGGQPTATAGNTDLSQVAKACGFKTTTQFSEESDMPSLIDYIHNESGPGLAVAKINSDKPPLKFPFSFDGVTAINRFQESILNF